MWQLAEFGRLRRDRGVPNARARVVLDDVKVRFVRNIDLEGLNLVLLRHGYDDAVRLPNGLQYTALGLVDIDGQGLHTRHVDITILPLVFQVGTNLFPGQIVADARRRNLQTVLRRGQQQHGVPVDTR